MLSRTTAINKLLKLNKRFRIIQGGTWAGKTYGIIATIIDYAIKNPDRVITIVAETLPAAKKGAMKDFKEIMYETGRWRQRSYRDSDRKYTFPNGSYVEFTSFDTVGKALSAGKRTDLFFNEANYIPWEIADALIMRTSGNVWLDFNPTFEFWAHTEISTNKESDFIVLRYSDNEACPDSPKRQMDDRKIKALSSTYWANWCRVYIDGEIGALQGAVFTNWKQVDKIPKEATLLGYGLDFGYTNDPSALLALYRCDGKRYYQEIMYDTGLTNPTIASIIKERNPYNFIVVADSADPKSIDEIKFTGVNITGAEKGPDSVNFGIDLMQQDEFYVTKDSVNMIKELRSYMWDKDKRTGKVLNTPVDAFNHLMDAARYISTKFIRARKQMAVTWGEE